MGLADRLAQAKTPTRTVPLCLNIELLMEIERLGGELAQALTADAAGSDSLSPNAAVTAPPIAAKILELEEQVPEFVLQVECRTVERSVWQALREDNPPSDEDREKGYGVDETSWTIAALVACCTGDGEPFTQELAAELVGKITPRQFQDLTDAIWALNMGVVDLPKSAVASAETRSSEPSATTASPKASRGRSSSGTADTLG
jgi:hypothetical protein